MRRKQGNSNQNLIVCAICGQEVSKRASLSLEPIGRSGRACRIHDKVVDMVERMSSKNRENTADADLLKMVEKDEDWFKVLFGAEAIRYLFSVEYLPEEALYEGLVRKGYSSEVIGKIRERVRVLGGPQVTPSEKAEFFQRKEKIGSFL